MVDSYVNRQKELARLFCKVVKQRNFMTPTLVEYGGSNGYVYEISTGRGIVHEKIYGVTIILGDERCYAKDRVFSSLEEARTYGESL